MTEADELLSNLLYDQRDLNTLCAERPLDWFEYAHMNEFHGNAAVIRRYAGVSADEPLPFGIEHAIPYDLRKAYEYDLESGLPMFLAVNEQSAQLYRATGITVHAVGFAYLYATALFRAEHEELRAERRGTLVFPDKSTLLMDTDFDRKAFVQRLKDLPAKYQPVVVCVYWKDYVRGTHREFEQADLPLVSCGHLRDGQFLFRFYDLCRRFRYACANDIAGSFTLSVLSGCHFFHLPGGSLRQEKYGKVESFEMDPGLLKPQKAACLRAAPFPPVDPAPQKALAEELAGVKYKLSPAEVRNLYQSACKMIASHAPTTPLRPQDASRRGEFFAFRPVGVDLDGWCRKRVLLRIPAGWNVREMRLKGQLPYPVNGMPPVLEMSLDGKLVESRELQNQEFEMVLKLPPKGKDCVVELRMEQDFQLANEPRKRAYLLTSIETSPGGVA